MRRDDDSSDPKLEDLLERNMTSLRSYVRKNLDAALADRESCSDLVQSVCREALQSRGTYSYQGDAAFRRWLFQIALHKLMERRRSWQTLKRGAQRQASPLSDWTRDELGMLAAQLGSPSGEAIVREELRKLEEALAQLDDGDREVIRLVRLQGHSHADAAQVLDCTEAQSRKHLFEALARLSLLLRAPKPAK